jgi:hypothetical protein
MSEYDNTNSGALFKNDKSGNEKRPDYRGQIDIEGAQFWLSAWIRKSKKGETFMSLKAQPKGERTEKQQSQPPTAPPDFDDDIPF